MSTDRPPIAETMRHMPRDIRKAWQRAKRMEAEGVLAEYIPPGEDQVHPWRRIYRAGSERTLGWVANGAVIRYTAGDPNDPEHFDAFGEASRLRSYPARSYSGLGGAMRWLDRLDKEEIRQRCAITISVDARPAIRALKSLEAATDAVVDDLSGNGPLTREDIWLLEQEGGQ